MAVATEPQVPLCGGLGAIEHQSFDCEERGSASTVAHLTRRSVAISIASRISVALGIIGVLALAASDVQLPVQVLEVSKRFMVHTPGKVPQLGMMAGHGTIPAANSRPLAPSVAVGSTRSSEVPTAMVMPQPIINAKATASLPALSTAARFVPSRTAASLAGGAAGAGVVSRARTPMMLSSSAAQVLTLLSVMGIGKLLQKRFPDKEVNVVQKLLLQFLVPATLFQGLCGMTVAPSQLGFVAAGIGMVLARIACSWVAAKTMLGRSTLTNAPILRRTAFFQISTMASAASVLPFAGEFLGAKYVGLGGLVDLPMKLWMLVIMPVALKTMGVEEFCVIDEDCGWFATLKKFFSDPISLSLVAGLAVGAITGGAGVASMGFIGKAITSLAGAQTAILFLLIGLKLNFNGATPVYSLVCILGTQGLLLLLASLLCVAYPFTDAMKQFILLFAQGSPSIVGLGVITAATNSGIGGYSRGFGLDIVGLAYPISACLQCVAGLFGASYAPGVSALLGAGLIGIAGLMRVGFRKNFRGSSADDKLVAA